MVDTSGTEEDVDNNLETALDMEVDGEGEGDGTLRELEATEFMNQDSETSSKTLVDDCNRFNKLIHLAMLWTVWHRWPAGARFAFNSYIHWAQLPLRQPGEPPVTILIREGVTQGDPLSMVLYGITLVPLTKYLRAADSGLLSLFYADDVAFGSLA